MPDPFVLLDDQVTGLTRRYSAPVKIIKALTAKDVPAAFAQIQSCHAQGYHLAGYLAYELGYILEPCLADLLPEDSSGRLINMGVFETFEAADLPPVSDTHAPSLALKPAWSAADYKEKFETVIAYIRAGDVYQINLTFPMQGHYSGSPEALYGALRARQAGRYGGIVSLGGPDIISLSPELFFQKTDQHMDMRPMKGTVRRQADPVQDAALRDAMRVDIKSQAENLMIVDLLRNDLSRIADTGSVKVPELFSLETYPTLHQMTSRVTASLRSDMGLEDIFKSLFPCGSVTGAPKIRAMEIIHALEDSPRGAYCGAMGYIDPKGDACFNVGIRTLTLDAGKVTYNVGSGVVLDSDAQDEYDECLLKAKVVRGAAPELIETMRWVPGEGILRRDRHLRRLARSAKVLGYTYPETDIIQKLESLKALSAQRVRLTLDIEGRAALEYIDFEPSLSKWRVSLSQNPLTSDVQETAHKLSAREFYDGERRRIHGLTGCDEILFFNKDGYLCEGSFTSVFLDMGGPLLTPHLNCGLLPGILREDLMAQGKAVEAYITIEDLRRARKVYLGNSLRGLIHVEIPDFSRY